MKVVLRRAAERDVEQAAAWYEKQRSGLGLEFMDNVRERMARVAENPEAYPVIVKDIRRALLRRFPYGPFYIIEPKRIVVIGCSHVRQSPRRWTRRKSHSDEL